MSKQQDRFDVIVVGGGHAGIESALAAARMGCQTLLLTLDADTIGQMSCNPAIGGLAKGHLVREIDALGGQMAITTDMTGIQFRTLNTKKGPAVNAIRAQCDRKAYQFTMKWICEREPNLWIHQAECTDFILENGLVCGVITSFGTHIYGQTVVVTTGTFLNGLMHIGSLRVSGGRAGDAAAASLSAAFLRMDIKLGRLKTGTSPRLLRRSIDFSKVQPQLGDEPIPFFTNKVDALFHMEQSKTALTTADPIDGRYPSCSVVQRVGRQMPCYVTRTTQATATIILSNLHKSPLYSGTIRGVGPRYCPSIEDKIVKFPDRPSHIVFLEPDGVSTDEVYVNGLATSLPVDVQLEIVRSVIGCERATIMRPGYAVEYDFVYPTQLLPSLETKACGNLFLAGQINGTSGYEEAAAQGLIAGINAALKVKGRSPLILRRDQAYIGVLIDDLVSRGTCEPYRMFTSRAECRLTLRHDNADSRLSQLGHEIGLLPVEHYERSLQKQSAIQTEIQRLEKTRFGSFSLAQLLKRPELKYEDLPNQNHDLPSDIKRQVEIEVKYAGYIRRQQNEVLKLKTLGEKCIPASFDYSAVSGLRNEARQKLVAIRPLNIAQASNIQGITPADIGVLMVWLNRIPQLKTSST